MRNRRLVAPALLASNLSTTTASSSSSPPRGLRGGGSYGDASSRIIGGDEAAAGRYPYAVSLSEEGDGGIDGHFCGGSLLGPDVVLSAAHCGAARYDVVVGRRSLDGVDGGEVIRVKEEVAHPDYDSARMENDLMLVFLERPASRVVEFVRLNSDETLPKIGAPVAVVGWGDTDAADDATTLSDVLLEVEVDVISNRECERSEGSIGERRESYDGKISENMMCAAGRGADSCRGDSGGPLVIRGSDDDGSSSFTPDVLVGVVSWGAGCAHPDFPGVYARVSSAHVWIREEVCRRSARPPSQFDCADLVLAPAPSRGPSTEWPTFSPTASFAPEGGSDAAAPGRPPRWPITGWPTFAPTFAPDGGGDAPRPPSSPIATAPTRSPTASTDAEEQPTVSPTSAPYEGSGTPLPTFSPTSAPNEVSDTPLPTFSPTRAPASEKSSSPSSEERVDIV